MIGHWKMRQAQLIALATLLALLGVVALPTIADAGDVTPFVVAIPQVSGPIASDDSSYPYIAGGFDVQPPVPFGYVEEEFLVSGTGDIYEYTSTGIRIVDPCPEIAERGCTNLSYTTRMLVKRPRDLRDFSGTVIIEPLNPSAGFDIAAVWDRSASYFVRKGHVFVGWTSKSVVVSALQSWDPKRYADLNWPYVPSPDGSANDGVYDGITFDIAAQIGALFRDNGPGSPLYGTEVQHVIEAGFSQDGGFTFTQADFFHGLERMPGDLLIYDGYVPGGTTGPSNINFGLTPAGLLSATDPRRAMQPREVPVIHVNTETEIFLGALNPVPGLAYRRPDGDDPNDRYRLWEVPGASHVSNDSNDPVLVLQLNLAELLRISSGQLGAIGCTHQEFVNGPARGVPGVLDPNNYPFSSVVNAAFANLIQWIDNDRPPPHADLIELDTSTPPNIVRDEFNNAMGGVRTPFLDVPTATYVPIDTVAHETDFSRFCILYGYNVPFDRDRLRSLYVSHQEYVACVRNEATELAQQRLWLDADAEDAVNRAAHARVP
jgi:hypothetical protein